tara:strand:+ start:340 stop:1428 length:1089 start_codon:yes stop_codon:yes gene_type:complete
LKKTALLLLALLSVNTQADELKAPVGVRPCCAFGVDLKAQLGKVPVPFFSLENVVNRDEVGTHHYNDGSTSVSGSLLGLADETNGLVFTQLGGFIDTAHVRDTADYTYYLFKLNQRYLGTNHQIDLPAELRLRRLSWHQQSKLLTAEQKVRYSAEAAALTAFRLAQWHEIAQWFGMVSVGGFDELASAFSSEDLYSNMLGAKLAKQILVNQPDLTAKQFGVAMDKAVSQTLIELKAVSKSISKEIIEQLDGVWWDSSKRLPNKWAVIYRDYHLGLELTPHYPGSTHPLSLTNKFVDNQSIEEWLTLSLVAADEEEAFTALPQQYRENPHWGSQDFQPLADFSKRMDSQAMRELRIKPNPIND